MAYDQSATYEPPRRNYMPQRHAANPAHNAYENDYAEYASSPYDNYEEEYGHQQNCDFGSQQAYSNGHAGGFQNNAYDRPQTSPERAYDPRYQPRAQHGPPPPGLGQHPAHRGPPPQARQHYSGEPRHDATPQQRLRDPYHERSPEAHARGNGQRKVAGPDSMAEWKAREKAKFKQQAPESLPLDNAFPVFPKRNETSMDRSGGAKLKTSGDRSRPQTSGESRPRENSHGPAPFSRPKYSQQDSNEGRYGQQSGGPQYETRREGASQQPSGHGRALPNEQYPAQWPIMDERAPIGQQHAGGADSGYGPDSHEQQYRQMQAFPQHNAAMQPFATRSHDSDANMDRQPLGQRVNMPRPTTSHEQATASAGNYPPDPRPWAHQASVRDSGRHSLGDIYDHYGTDSHAPEPQPGQLKMMPTNRAEEIEFEMPDFDSAAPGQSSRVQRKAAPPAIDSLTTSTPPPISSARSAPPNGYHQQLPYYQANRSTPGPGPPRGGPPPNRRPAPPAQGYDLPYRAPPQQNSGNGRGEPMHPPRAPFAHEGPVRRSLDDGRQGSRRPGPPPQRYDQFGRPLGPPRGRPDLDRSATWADSRQPRGDGPRPPPHQQGPRGPPGATGAPVTQLRSNPGPSGNGYNPDALPQHPVPVRPGLMNQGESRAATKPLPVRNYNGTGSLSSSTSGPPPPTSTHDRQASIDRFAQPVTLAEIEQLRAAADSTNSPKQGLILVRKLVEAGAVLATEGGRADQKTTANNRERYVMEAYKRLKKLVTNGYPDAQFYLADCYGQGMLGLEVDTKEAFKLYQAAAKAGHAQAAYRTAVCCEMGPEEGGGTSRDYSKAVQWYRRAAALGDAAAMYKLGAILLKSLLGQPKNIAEAVTWLKRGAERADVDHPHALHELAGLYESANNNPEVRNKVIADDAYARELFQQAAGLGYKFSQFRLGQAYEYGALGLTIDNRTSISWYTKAAAQGEHQAELALSGWYLTGAEGVLEHSETEAYLWARKAAASEPPLPKAMFAMGYFTENGIGCPASMEEARKWYGRAASHKFPKAIERLEELKKGGKNGKAAPAHGKLSRKEGKRDQKKDEENCSVM